MILINPSVTSLVRNTVSVLHFLDCLIFGGKYLLHGSPIQLNVLEPRKANDFSKVWGNIVAVYATTKSEIALFHAVFNPESLPRGIGSFRWGYASSAQAFTKFYASPKLNRADVWGNGHVYVLTREDFESLENSSEYRSFKAIRPVIAVPVLPSDFLRYHTVEFNPPRIKSNICS